MNSAWKIFLVLIALGNSLFAGQPPLRKSQSLEIPHLFSKAEPNSLEAGNSSAEVSPKYSDSPSRGFSPERIREESFYALTELFNKKTQDLDIEQTKALNEIYNSNHVESKKAELLRALDAKQADNLKELAAIIIKRERNKLTLRREEIAQSRKVYYDWPGISSQFCNIDELKCPIEYDQKD